MVPSFFGNLRGNLHSKKEKACDIDRVMVPSFFVNFDGKYILKSYMCQSPHHGNKLFFVCVCVKF